MAYLDSLYKKFVIRATRRMRRIAQILFGKANNGGYSNYVNNWAADASCLSE